MTSAETAPRLDMGRVVKTTFAALGGNLVVFGLLSMVLIGIPDGIVEWLGNLAKAKADSGAAGGFALLERLVDTIGTVVLTGALIHGANEHLAGRRAPVGESFRVGLRNSAKVFGINFISGLGVLLGLLLLVVPGVILALRWSVAAPAGVVERLTVGHAMERSAVLTKGNRWPILGLFTALIIGFFAVALLFDLCAGFIGAFDAGVESVASAVVGGLSNALLTLFLGVGPAVIYAELRSAREGVLPDQLASMFD